MYECTTIALSSMLLEDNWVAWEPVIRRKHLCVEFCMKSFSFDRHEMLGHVGTVRTALQETCK